MQCKYCYVLLLISVSLGSAVCANPTGYAGPQHGSRAATSDDMSNMVASLLESGGSNKMESDELDWTLDLDSAGDYRLSWRSNVSANEILFSLSIDVGKSNFRLGTDVIALGFSERGQLSSCDFCIIWHDLSHRLHLQDARTNEDNILELIDPVESVCNLVSKRKPEIKSTWVTRDTETNTEYDDNEGVTEYQTSGERHGAGGDSGGKKFEVSFTRPLEVCAEPRQRKHLSYYTIDSGTTHLVWFTLRGPLLALDGLNLNEALNLNNSGSMAQHRETGEHSRGKMKGLCDSGMRRVQLIASKSAASDAVRGSSSRVFDVLMDKYAIPAKETTYMCKLFKLPAKFELRRYHITSYEALIEPGNEHVVHHMELFSCANLSADELRDLEAMHSNGSDWAGECSSDARPRSTDSCKRVILAWAMGARPLVYPEQVGQSIGGTGYSPYVMLEIHYNNVAQSAGLVDSSGLRFHYSPRLRPFDAGVLEVGLEYTDKNSIPPNMVTPLAGYCVSECTRAAMSAADQSADRKDGSSGGLGSHQWHRNYRQRHLRDREDEAQASARSSGEGIYIFAAQLHTHLTGIASWTEHVRGGRLVGELQRDNHYSPHFQEIRLLPEPVHIAPGDALIHYCLYDTRQRPNITLGGFATTDEMCVTYLHYYPKVDLEVCKSSVDTSALSEYFAYLAREENQRATPISSGEISAEVDKERRAKSVSESYRSIVWTPRRSRELIEFYNKAPLSVQCNRSDGRRWPGFWNGIEPTRINKRPPWEADERHENAKQFVEYRGIGATRRGHCAGNPRNTETAPAGSRKDL